MRLIRLALMLLPWAALHAGDNHLARPLIGGLQAERVLFLGNSITLHAPAPNIGWTGNWGMAATRANRILSIC